MENEPPPQCVIPLHKPSLTEYIFFFATGIVISIPFAVFFEGLYPTGLPTIILLVVLAPLIEELAKVFPLFYRHGETERSIVTIGILIGAGFGISEFFLYVFIGGVPAIARLPGIIFHASSAGIVAYGIAKKNPLIYYIIAVGLHALNNLAASTGDAFSIFVQLLVLVVTYLLAWQLYHRASKKLIVV